MAKDTEKVPVKSEAKPAERPRAVQTWRPFEGLRREVDRLFEDFGRDFWPASFRRPPFDLREPFGSRELFWRAPTVDIVEKDNAYEVTAELPGMDEKDIEVKVANGYLTIRGEKEEEKEEKKKDYHLRERHFGTFERQFPLPAGIDTDKIEASFKKGVLTVTLPKKPEAIKPEKKIEVKTS